MVRIEVLGPLQVIRAEDGVVMRPRGLQAVLLSLLVADSGRTVTHERLTDAMWGASADPVTAHRLQTHVHRLRAAMGPTLPLVAEPGGYRLDVDAADLDAGRFEQLVASAAESLVQDPARTADLAREALALWRGDPFQGLSQDELSTTVRRLQDLRLSALELRFAAELACGRHQSVADELPSVIEEHPLRERLHELLITSHAAAGRQADALAAYHRARRLLVDELGVEPGRELQNLQAKILAGEDISDAAPPTPSIPHPGPSSAASASGPTVPAQLPARPRGFVGRAVELRELAGWRADDADPASVFLITGGAGVGKTALALQWAHALADETPDGQLYTDLRGFGPDAPLRPEHALIGLLRALGVPTADVPGGLDERAALFRSRVAGRRLLLLLDDARDVDQVRPLLPGSSTCTVVVTSRRTLSGLVVQEGAHQLALSRMDDDEARELIGRLIGTGHAPEHLDGLARSCAHLPLAIRVAAELARTRGGEDLGAVVEELEDEQGRLDMLDAGDDRTSVRGVFAWSYRELDERAAWMFRCLGTAPSHELSLTGLAALTDLDPRAARRAADTLRRAHLVEADCRDRYRLHDLLRAYAVELAEAHDDEQSRRAAVERLCRHYEHTIAAAMEQMMPEEMYFPEARALLDDVDMPRPFATPQEADRWVELELEDLLTTAERCDADRAPWFPGVMSALLRRHLDPPPYLHAAQRLHGAALRAGHHLGDLRAQAEATKMLGRVAMLRAQYTESKDRLTDAVALLEQAGDALGEAGTRTLLGAVHVYLGDVAAGLAEHASSVRTLRALDDPALCFSLSNLGFAHHVLGREDEARAHFDEALSLSRRTGRRYGESVTLVNLALSHASTGEHENALSYAHDCLRLATTLGRRERACQALICGGRALAGLGRPEAGRRLVRSALTALEELAQEEPTAMAHHALGDLARQAGQLQQSRSHLELALEHTCGRWDLQADVLISLGETCSAAGDAAGALDAWHRALGIRERVGHAGAEGLRDRIVGGARAASAP